MSRQNGDPDFDEALLTAELKRLRRFGLRRRKDTAALSTLEAIAKLLADSKSWSINDQIKAAIDAGSKQMSELRGLAVRELLDAGSRKDRYLEERRKFVAKTLKIEVKTLEGIEDDLFAELARSLVRLAREQQPEPEPDPLAPETVRSESESRPSLPRRWIALRPAGTVLVAAVLIVALTLAPSGWLHSSVASVPTAELARLSGESDQVLVGDQAPVPGDVSRQLGYGDPTPQGRTVYPYVAHRAEQGAPPQNTPVPTTPALDVLTDAPGVSDERRFFQIITSEVPQPHSFGTVRRSAFVRQHANVRLWLYIDNAATPEPNCEQLVGSTIAKHTTVRVAIWDSPDKHLHIIRAWVYAENAQPTWITDAVAVVTERADTLHFVPSLSSQYSESPMYRSRPPLTSSAIVEPGGMSLGGDGLLGSCWQNRFILFLTFRQD
ncbi:MAG TPA: hypothetical protein VK778_09590 [Solirubrobacteraceae bacterium]|nr:hypothetical protein [Solirubrobacteraceae bacterium]